MYPGICLPPYVHPVVYASHPMYTVVYTPCRTPRGIHTLPYIRVEGGGISRHRPPCHPEAILLRMFSLFLPGYTMLGWLTVLVNGALLHVAG